jgi:L-threonylcarbamoyladenylate synthase
MDSTAELINIDDAPELAVNQASKIFNTGNVFIYPTDTVYGFGCNPFNKTSLKKLDTIKGRVSDKRYILLVDSLEMLFNYIVIPKEQQIELLNKIWPNPVSVILRLNESTRKKLDYNSAAFRIPDNTFCMNLLKEVKTPLVSTSVNITGEKQLNKFSEFKSEFADKVAAIFYTKNESPAEPSTLIDLTKSEPVVLREGKIKFIEL